MDLILINPREIMGIIHSAAFQFVTLESERTLHKGVYALGSDCDQQLLRFQTLPISY